MEESVLTFDKAIDHCTNQLLPPDFPAGFETRPSEPSTGRTSRRAAKPYISTRKWEHISEAGYKHSQVNREAVLSIQATLLTIILEKGQHVAFKSDQLRVVSLESEEAQLWLPYRVIPAQPIHGSYLYVPVVDERVETDFLRTNLLDFVRTSASSGEMLAWHVLFEFKNVIRLDEICKIRKFLDTATQSDVFPTVEQALAESRVALNYLKNHHFRTLLDGNEPQPLLNRFKELIGCKMYALACGPPKVVFFVERGQSIPDIQDPEFLRLKEAGIVEIQVDQFVNFRRS